MPVRVTLLPFRVEQQIVAILDQHPAPNVWIGQMVLIAISLRWSLIQNTTRSLWEV